MDADIPKLPKYVFRRANGSYRYKRNVPKALRQVIPKATVYRQLGDSYDEAIRRLPVVHAEVEALFDQERKTPDSKRATGLVRERLGEWHANAFAEEVVDPEWDIMDDFVELAEDLEGGATKAVTGQIASAKVSKEPMTLKRVLEEYYSYKCDDAGEDRALKTRIERLRKDLVIALGKNRVEWTPLAEITHADANAFHRASRSRTPISNASIEPFVANGWGNGMAGDLQQRATQHGIGAFYCSVKLKMGIRTPNRADKVRHEYQAVRDHRHQRTTGHLLFHSRTGKRSYER